MHANQNDTTSPHPFLPLNRDLPEILVQREQDAAPGFGPLKNVFVAGAWKIPARPQNIMVGKTHVFDNPAREILIRENLHLCR